MLFWKGMSVLCVCVYVYSVFTQVNVIKWCLHGSHIMWQLLLHSLTFVTIAPIVAIHTNVLIPSETILWKQVMLLLPMWPADYLVQEVH